MTNLSLRGLDDATAKRLKLEAQRRGLSVNALVIRLLQESLGTRKPTPWRAPYHDLDLLAGTWSKQEAAVFLKAVAGCERLDEELWR